MEDLEMLYNKYFKDIYLFLLGLSKNKELAEDLTQETFLKALKGISTFRGDSSIKTWLFQIAKNLLYTNYRKGFDLPLEDIANRGVEFTEKILDEEASEEIVKILDGMKEINKDIFYLRVFGELSFKEIGHIFGKSANWACVTYYRTKEKIRGEMEDENNL
ncbi:MAG: RNA polymerase sigma factor [Tissierellia bacterium]|nr:RNA polymerase sigma factor [Tissierellia bacterium]